jgi:hypothetical protein
MEITANAL